MSEENIEIARRAYTAFHLALQAYLGGEDWEAIPEWDEVFAPEVVLEEVAEIPDSATYNGIEELKSWFRAGTETFGDVRWEPSRFLPIGPNVVTDVRGIFRGGSSGAEVEVDVHHVFTIRDGRIVHVRGYLDRAKALDVAADA